MFVPRDDGVDEPVGCYIWAQRKQKHTQKGKFSTL